MSYKRDIMKVIKTLYDDLEISIIALEYLKSKKTPYDTFVKHCQLCIKVLSFSFPIYSGLINEILDQILAQKHVQKKDIDLLKYILSCVISDIDKIIKPKKIFISHSSKDCVIVDNFVDLLVQIGLKRDHLFCSSSIGFGIPQGSGDIYDYLKSEFENNDIFVIFMLSKNYYSSLPCLNEMGAAWIIKSEYQAVLLPEFEFSDITGALNPRTISFKLDDINNRNHSLNEMKDNILKKLELPLVDQNIWERYRDKFLDFIDNYVY